uniref:Dynein heavy chain tail domain-containing protein n=1 Tax=Neogobius melanostomus TaxID=47308 RepID=A0A8C6TCK7_9GOBI
MTEAPSSGKSSARLGSSGTAGVRVPQEPSLKVGVVLDERVDFLREQAFCVLRVKTDKWNRFIGAEENQKIILDFLDHIWTNLFDSFNSILMYFNNKLGNMLYTAPPWKTKILCVIKRGVKRVSREEFKHQLRLGEVPGYPMEHLPLVISEVLTSVLSNGLNHEDWPRVVSEDIHRHLEKLRSKVVTLRGRAEGRTLLPLPLMLCVFLSSLSPTGWPVDRSLLYSIETLIIQWSGQIWSVLQKDSGMMLQGGDCPVPSAELHFWSTQRENLRGIQAQIQSPKVQKIMDILKRVESSYFYSFLDVCHKADDIDLYLRPLRRMISNLEERSFPHTEDLLHPLYHTLCLIWSHSKCYCTPQRMVVLLQEFCNLIIEKAFAYLIPEELFKMELEEGVERVQITISVLQTFKQLFHTYRQKVPQYYKYSHLVKLWDFPASLVFQRTDRIMGRLHMIEVSLDFLKLEKVELGGSRGKVLKILTRGWERFLIWLSNTSKTSSPPSRFASYKLFLLQWWVWHFLPHFILFHMKLLKIFGTLLDRPRIHQLFSPNYNVVLVLFCEEIDQCQFILEQHKDQVRPDMIQFIICSYSEIGHYKYISVAVWHSHLGEKHAFSGWKS